MEDRTESFGNVPNLMDGLLLMALSIAETDGLSTAYAFVDAINRVIIEPREWEHACRILGVRGLIVSGQNFPSVTDAGRSLVTTLSFEGARELARKLNSLPSRFEPATPPSQEVQREAYEAYYQRMEMRG